MVQVPDELFDSWDQSIVELPYGKFFSTVGFDGAVAPLIEEGLVRTRMDVSVEALLLSHVKSLAKINLAPLAAECG